MDSSVALVSGAIVLVIVLLMAIGAWTFFRRYKSLASPLNRAHEMSMTTDGTISKLVTVYRRNRSFKWKNEYPVIAYQANGKDYTIHMKWAEKRQGHYQLGGKYRVCYVPADPGCSVVEEFRQQMQKARTQSLIWTVVLAFFAVNGLFGALSQLLTIFIQ